jgi:hypothetical protein
VNTSTSDTPDGHFTLAESQHIGHYTSNGVHYPRIPFGSDDPRWGEIPCRGCGAVRGQFHTAGNCAYEHCPVCRASQLGTCTHTFVELGDDGQDLPVRGPTIGDRVLTGILLAIITLCIVATILATLRII